MKIHGTAKGGAISKKDFGVAFTAAEDPGVFECWWTDELDSIAEYNSTSDDNYIVASKVTSTSNEMYDWGTVATVSVFACAHSGVSAGKFVLGVWGSDGNNKAKSAEFTSADFAVGTTVGDMEKITKSLTSTTTIANGDNVGIMNVEAVTGTGDVSIGQYNKGTNIANWARNTFVEGASDVLNQNRAIPCCLGT